MAMKDKRLFVVLGMHRSGTSAVTKSLEAAGVALGNNLLQASKDNVKGYFEDRRVNELNTGLLESFGHRWNTLGLIKPSSFDNDNLDPFRERARELLKSEFEVTDLFGIKDPRMCRLLPFWLRVFQDLDVKVSYVIVLRDPHSIAASLLKRDAIPGVKALYMWSTHMMPVLIETIGLNRAFVNYDELVENPRRSLVELSRALDLEQNLTESSVNSFVSDFVDIDLRHHRSTDDSTGTSTPRLISRLINLTNEIATSQDAEESSFINKLKRINSELEDRSGLLKYIDTLDEIIIHNHHKSNAIEELASQLEDAQKTANELLQEKSRAGMLERELEATKAELKRRDLELNVLSKTNSEQLQRIEALEHELTLANESLEESALQLMNVNSDFAEANRTLESYVTHNEELTEKLEEIKTSLFWRCSGLSRKIWGKAELLFRRRSRLRLLPANDLIRQKPGEYRWVSSGPDPYFRLIPTAGKLPCGWIHIESTVQTDACDQEAKLYIDLGDGFNEETAVVIPILSGGRISQFVHIPEELKSLRWDPLCDRGEFQQYPILISKKSGISRRLHMIKRVVNVMRLTSSITRNERNIDWKVLFSGLEKAYSIADRIIISRNQQDP